MLPRFTVLGGSSPFTVALLESIALSSDSIPPHELVLHGRNVSNLQLVHHYAGVRLAKAGWQIKSTTSTAGALDGASIVLHQVRYGDLAGRELGERLASKVGVPADETLGPAALQTALQMAPHLSLLAANIRRYSPGAWILNLTNPMSIAVSVLTENGVARCIGLCELPLITLREACAFLSLEPEQVEWSYYGLNHRGFVYDLSHEGADCLPLLVERMGYQKLGGVAAEQIAEIDAIPLKYFNLLCNPAQTGAGRAALLTSVRNEISDQLRQNPCSFPPAMRKRYMDWYPHAVVPMLASLSSRNGSTEIVNAPLDGKITLEFKARIFADHFEPIQVSRLNPKIKAFIEKFRRHEQATLTAVLSPSRERIEAALRSDPLVPERHVAALTDDLCHVAQALPREPKTCD
jgi:6-phospho-beta-glucosidase